MTIPLPIETTSLGTVGEGNTAMLVSVLGQDTVKSEGHTAHAGHVAVFHDLSAFNSYPSGSNSDR